jgi:hypothetical protein
MTSCKHRWEEVTYFKSLAPNRYAYHCKRCSQLIFATLKEKQNGH